MRFYHGGHGGTEEEIRAEIFGTEILKNDVEDFSPHYAPFSPFFLSKIFLPNPHRRLSVAVGGQNSLSSVPPCPPWSNLALDY
jgi:hypothetical protein